MDDNDLFLAMGEACDYKTRLKGYYICNNPFYPCGEYIKPIPRKTAACPFCGKENKLVLRIDSWQEQVTTSIWKDGGYYSDVRAGKIIKKEGVA